MLLVLMFFHNCNKTQAQTYFLKVYFPMPLVIQFKWMKVILEINYLDTNIKLVLIIQSLKNLI